MSYTISNVNFINPGNRAVLPAKLVLMYFHMQVNCILTVNLTRPHCNLLGFGKVSEKKPFWISDIDVELCMCIDLLDLPYFILYIQDGPKVNWFFN